jgi:hypothetical protein
MKMTPMEKGNLMGANPYGKKKEWDGEGKTGQAFISADDSMAYKSTPKTAMIDKMEDGANTPAEATPQPAPTVEDGKYSTVDYKKRYDDLKGHYDKKVNEFKGIEKDLKTQLTNNAPKYVPPTSPEELEVFRKENPQIYNLVETVAHMQASNELEALKGDLKTVRENLALSEATQAYEELKNLVPDFEAIRNDNAFHVWAEQQIPQIQAWVYNNSTDVTLAAQAINLYKASLGNGTPQGQQPPSYAGADQAVQTRSGRTEVPTNPQGKIWSQSEIGGLSGEQFEQYSGEIDLAFAEGRVVTG